MVARLGTWIILLASSLLLMLSVLPGKPLAIDCKNPASSKDQLQCGACGASGINGTDCNTQAPKTVNTLNGTIKNAINIFSIITGVVAVVMIIVAGFRYITSGGAEQAVAGAKRTLMYAVIGLVIVAFAQIISRFTLSKATQTSSSTSQQKQGP